ncbi:hypothetical protein ACF1AX_36075 [Streptomyces sp. NPDC014802]|uniref:ATP-dependent DNA ligase n=1 Tax=Streptomyces sp. NPDC014802 TaxID=3364917 RepID=UPI003700F33A
MGVKTEHGRGGRVSCTVRTGASPSCAEPAVTYDAPHCTTRPPATLVLDGELVVWAGEGMSFEALQQRAAAGHRSAPLLAQELPAHLIVFDVLQVDGRELLHAPYAERRAHLEQLFTDHDLHASWARCPETDDPATGQEWLTSWTRVPGVEGLIIRGTEQHYLRGAHALYKVAATPPKPSSAPSPEACSTPRHSSWAATTTPADCARSAAAHPSARTPHASSPSC